MNDEYVVDNSIVLSHVLAIGQWVNLEIELLDNGST